MSTKKRKGKPPKGYDSWFEYELHLGVLKDCEYHPRTITYVQEKQYEPDFVVKGFNSQFLIEAKGRVRDSEEARKYVDIRKQLDNGTEGLNYKMELVFLFYHPDTPMPRARRRHDGSRFTMAEWADKNGFRYYTSETITTLLKEAEVC